MQTCQTCFIHILQQYTKIATTKKYANTYKSCYIVHNQKTQTYMTACFVSCSAALVHKHLGDDLTSYVSCKDKRVSLSFSFCLSQSCSHILLCHAYFISFSVLFDFNLNAAANDCGQTRNNHIHLLSSYFSNCTFCSRSLQF